MISKTSLVVSQIQLSENCFRLDLFMPEIAEVARPGQFVEISTNNATLLNKPISIAAVSKQNKTFSLIYKVVGKGTKALSKLIKNDKVKVIGPCGNGFQKVESFAYGVGGGIGIPPIFFLAAENNISTKNWEIILGAGTFKDLVLTTDFKTDLEISPIITTDDGSTGLKGNVCLPLEEKLKIKPAPVYACGPMPMLAAISNLCKNYNVTSHVCMEAYMGCGIGVCMGCVIPTVRGFERVCKEGPVFLGKDVSWDKL